MSANHLNEMIMQQTQPPPEVTLPNAETGKKVTRDTSTFVYMGFPRRTFDKNPAFTYSGRQIVESSVSFVCPRCHNRTLEIPTSCCVCGLQLNSSSHIARSHHHLFPVPNFSEFHNDHDSVTSITSTNGHDSTKSSLATANGSLKLMKSANTMSLKFVKTTTSTIDTTKYSTSSSVQKYCSGCFFPFYDNDNQQNSFNHNSLQMQCPKCLKLFCVECDIFIHDSLHNCPGCNHQELLRS
jgi:transcription initiation factor TFIIH subunit 2